MKIIFLDFDGPMLPGRCYTGSRRTDQFDECAVGMVNSLLADSGAKLVMSTSWATRSREDIAEILSRNGIDPAHLHDDWRTPRKFSSARATEIRWWLDEHPEVTHWVAFDDEPTPKPGGIRVSFDDGIQWKHYRRAQQLLGIEKSPLLVEMAMDKS